MNTADIINQILYYARLNPNQFAKKVGVSQQQISNLKEGKVKTLSTNFIRKLLAAFPELNYDYLMTGEGDMIRQTEKSTVNGNGNNTAANNHHSTININTELAKGTIEILNKQLREKDDQIKDLLYIIKNLSDKKKGKSNNKKAQL